MTTGGGRPDGDRADAGGLPLLSPAVRDRLGRLGIAPDAAPAGGGLGGRLRIQDLPPDPAEAVGGTQTPAGGVLDAPRRRSTAQLLERARRRAEDMVASAQLTSAAELDVTPVVSHALAADGPQSIRGAVLAAVVAAVAATLDDAPTLAATVDEDLTGLHVPDRVRVRVVDATASLGTGGPLGDDVGGVPTSAHVLVHDRLSSGVLLETPLLERPAALALVVGGLARRVRTASDGAVGPRWTTMLSVTYDHRVIDGADAARLLAAVRARLA